MLYRIFAAVYCVLYLLVCPAQAKSEEAPRPRLGPDLKSQLDIPVKSAGAETLYTLTEATLREDGHWQRTYYFSIRLNDMSAARDYGRIAIRFNHYYSETTLDFANTLSKDGSIIALKKDAIQNRVTGGGQDFYSDSSEIVFSLPDVSPGTILEFQYTKKSKILPFAELHALVSIPHWFQSTVANDSWRADFVHHYQYSFTHPNSTKIYIKAMGGHTKKVKKSKTKTATTLTWKMQDIDEVVAESWFPRKEKIYPELAISTMVDWSHVDRWTWEKVADKLPRNRALDAAIKSLNLPAKATTEEKIHAVYEYVQSNIRYVFAHLGRGGYEPHFPSEVIQTRYGDCKDQTVLTVALLRILGVEAYPALVETPRAGNDDTSLVKLIFDHMIVYIPKQPGTDALWMDTTGDRSLYPGMSAYLGGQNAMIINGRGGNLTHIPEDLYHNKAKMSMAYTQHTDGSSSVDLQLELNGSFEQDVRGWWISDSNRDENLDQYLKGIFNNALDYEVEGEVSHSEDLFQAIRMTARYKFKRDEDDQAPVQAASIKQLLGLFTDLPSLPLADKRINRFVDPYTYTLEMDVTFSGLDSDLLALIQSSGNIETPYFTLTQTGNADDNKFYYSATYQKYPLNLSVAEYRNYYDAAQSLNKIKPWIVSLNPSVQEQKKQELANIETTYGDNSIELKIAMARQLIEKGDFKEALVHAHAAVKMDTSNGEAWYVLATAQGFNTMLEQSSASFAKAEALGYLP